MGVLFEDRLPVGGYETRVLEVDGEGPPLLLLHGWSDSADTWLPVIDRLRRRGRRAVALDLPGFGTASRLSQSQEVLPQLDRFVRAALVRFSGGEGTVIVGNSLGGCMALRAAENEDLPIAGVIGLAPAGIDLARWLTVIAREPVIRAVLGAPVPVPGALIRGVVAQLFRRLAFADAQRAPRGSIANFCNHLGTRAAAANAIEVGLRLRPEIAQPFRMDRVGCPVLLVWGDRDRMTPISGAEPILAGIEGARLERLHGYGHCPQLEAPDRVCELIEEFIGELAPAGKA
jgi:pimeloyl-ACP methyl ester carboxylesterase